LPDDWERAIQSTPYGEGRHQAARLCGQPTPAVIVSLERAREDRARARSWLFRRAEQDFLDGFIDRLAEEVSARAEAGDPSADRPGARGERSNPTDNGRAGGTTNPGDLILRLQMLDDLRPKPKCPPPSTSDGTPAVPDFLFLPQVEARPGQRPPSPPPRPTPTPPGTAPGIPDRLFEGWVEDTRSAQTPRSPRPRPSGAPTPQGVDDFLLKTRDEGARSVHESRSRRRPAPSSRAKASAVDGFLLRTVEEVSGKGQEPGAVAARRSRAGGARPELLPVWAEAEHRRRHTAGPLVRLWRFIRDLLEGPHSGEQDWMD
jgi:hypothetical protein